MITPLEIQNKEFKKVMRGYKESEVDEFLDRIIVDYEKLYKENIELKDKITLLNEQIERYANLEKTLNNTLIVAQSTAEEVATNAHRKAELIIKEAEDRASKIIEQANQEIMKARREHEEVKKQMQIFRTRFKTLLEAQLEAVTTTCSEIINDDDDAE
ncbi:DivIVA domain-containing protein [Geosporobacter ferrireducens]|uniref:Septum formation initiator n=1 Tax=Geosporobacter ferrireducens TaxID=1424294 RepID=A0A1D8GC07_9FIRM|nr:DivIVA domain-containing protein [Geosporobacter ferrireducens]AOT68433.1 septum formation initiator [Geosporobacter ferrireducens]MTI53889.1 DivIVA domain-containing protein [Geosporobacter ferrireducens]